MLNDEASLFFSSRQNLRRHRSQRDTLNTVWQTLARLLGAAGLTSKAAYGPQFQGAASARLGHFHPQGSWGSLSQCISQLSLRGTPCPSLSL